MRIHSSGVGEHVDVPLADDGALEETIARCGARQIRQRAASEGGNACFVVSVHTPRDLEDGAWAVEAQAAEISGLVEAQGDQVVGLMRYRLDRPEPRTLLRSGVAARIGEQARDAGADLLVVDAELSPSQTRNLEDATGLPVADREAVILNVFERHARSRRARIQVEIAHLEYLRPRIRGIGLNMDQQAGGIMGSRGPGETASELLARRIDGRLSDLRRGLAQLQRADRAQRKHRKAARRVALVGYTNAGKTSLMNALTDAGLSARARPFETLDATARCLTRHGGDVLLSDTVGFIRRLPERLLASFESTLAEAREASLLLVVIDVSDPERARHLATTAQVLERLGAAGLPRLVLFNKADRLPIAPDAGVLSALAGGHPHLLVSAHDAASIARLREALLAQARADQLERTLFVPYTCPELIARVYAECRVLEAVASAHGTQLRVAGDGHVVRGLARAVRAHRRGEGRRP